MGHREWSSRVQFFLLLDVILLVVKLFVTYHTARGNLTSSQQVPQFRGALCSCNGVQSRD
jgi:hypothetical protein